MLAGLGIGQQLREFVQPFLETGKLIPILQDWYRPSFPFYAVYHPNKHHNARVEVFVNWLIEKFRQ